MVQFGCDYSAGLLSICRKRHFQSVRCNCLNVPFRDAIANACICIAVIHHLTTEERRRHAIREIARILKPNKGAKALIYAWAKEQEKDAIASSYIKKNQSKDDTNPCGVISKLKPNMGCDTEFPLILPIHRNRTNFEHTDLLVPWKRVSYDKKYSLGSVGDSETEIPMKNNNLQYKEKLVHTDQSQTFHRFYHVFEEGELERLILSIPNLQVEESYYDQGNKISPLLEQSHLNPSEEVQ